MRLKFQSCHEKENGLVFLWAVKVFVWKKVLFDLADYFFSKVIFSFFSKVCSRRLLKNVFAAGCEKFAQNFSLKLFLHNNTELDTIFVLIVSNIEYWYITLKIIKRIWLNVFEAFDVVKRLQLWQNKVLGKWK